MEYAAILMIFYGIHRKFYEFHRKTKCHGTSRDGSEPPEPSLDQPLSILPYNFVCAAACLNDSMCKLCLSGTTAHSFYYPKAT